MPTHIKTCAVLTEVLRNVNFLYTVQMKKRFIIKYKFYLIVYYLKRKTLEGLQFYFCNRIKKSIAILHKILK